MPWPGSWARPGAMIERHYGTLLDGALESITGRLDALDAEPEAKEEVAP